MPDNELPGSEGWLSPKTVLLIFTGAIVPIVAALIPWALDFSKTREDFRYSVTGPIRVKNQMAFSVDVQNKGRVVEKNVEVWIPKSFEAQKFEIESIWELGVPIKIRDEQSRVVVSLGDMRPKDRATIAVLTNMGDVRFSGETSNKLRDSFLLGLILVKVVSADKRADWSWPGERETTAMDFVYRAGFWGFVIVAAGAFLWALPALLRRRVRARAPTRAERD